MSTSISTPHFEKGSDDMLGQLEELVDAQEATSESAQKKPSSKETKALDEASPEAKVQVKVTSQIVQQCKMFLDGFGVDVSELTDEEVVQKVVKIKKAKETHAQVLSRGKVLDSIDRLLKFVPKGYIGEFKRENPNDIHRAKALGFEVFVHEEAAVASSTGTADGKVRLGDQILMIIPEEEYIAMHMASQDNIRHRRASRAPEAQARDAEVDPRFPIIPL